MTKILFVCHGNICRSPMAEFYMKDLADRAGMAVPTLRRLLNTGAGSLENYLRVARVLGLLDAAVAASDPLNTPMGRLRADEDTPQRVRR